MLIIWKEVSWSMRRTQQYNAVCADMYTCKNYVPSWHTSWINYMLFVNNMPPLYIIWSYFNLWSGHHKKCQVISYLWQIHNLHIITLYFNRKLLISCISIDDTLQLSIIPEIQTIYNVYNAILFCFRLNYFLVCYLDWISMQWSGNLNLVIFKF